MSSKRKTKIKQNEINNEANVNSVFPPPETDENTSLWHDPFVHILLILAVGFISYCNALAVPFVFDDIMNLVENPAIMDFECFWNENILFNRAILYETVNNIILRPVTYFTFALNYSLHGLSTFGYHITNLLIHIANAIMVYLLFSRIQATPKMMPDSKDNLAGSANKWFLPLFAALFFVSHPIQTQSVVYIVQRFVPLATFFYLGALILYDTAKTSSSLWTRSFAYMASLVATVLAMGSKEIAFTLPVMILLYELMFFSGELKIRLARITPFFLTMAIIPMKLGKLAELAKANGIETQQSGFFLRSIGGASPFEYLITQFGVITTYLRLLFFPVNQNLDYDCHLQTSFFSLQVILPLLLLLAIAGCGIFCLISSKNNRCLKIVAFGIFWFFITISVESSIVPINDLMFEHRIYLPSVGFFMLLFTTVSLLFQHSAGHDISQSKPVVLIFVLLVVILATTSIARNKIWKDEETLWRDVVKKSPDKARGHAALAAALLPPEKQLSSAYSPPQFISDMSKLNEATEEGLKALSLGARDVNSYLVVVKGLLLQNRSDEAMKYAEEAIRLKPAEFKPLVAKGEILMARGRVEEAEQAYRTALMLAPRAVGARWRLAFTLALQGDREGAIRELEYLLRIYPNKTIEQKLEELKRG